MCGLAGTLFLSNARHDVELSSIIEKMSATLSHRGPDDASIYIDDQIGISHKRLSILDLSERASQPMVSQNSRYVLAYNGEIYNYKKLRQQYFQNKVFSSDSDTEVLLELISQEGIESTLAKLNGMFAFVLWDKEEKMLYLARDRMGIKPLYWSLQNNTFLFGSELKALLSYPGWKGEINSSALGDYFRQYYIRAPQTIYQNCYKLLPGTFITVHGNDLSYQLRHYYSIEEDQIDLGEISFDDAEKELDQLLTESVKMQLAADVPIAAFLSGGVDSSLIVSKILEFKKVSTFSVGYHEKTFDESDKSSEVAAILGSDHHQFILTPNEAFKVLERLPEIYDEPFADASQIPTHFISNKSRAKAKVVLSGDGADELFSGYQRYTNSLLSWKRLLKIPSILRTLSKGPLYFLPKSVNLKKISALKKYIGCQSLLEYHLVSNYIGMENISFSSLPIPSNKSRSSESQFSPSASLLSQLLMDDQRYRLPDGMLTKVDRASMAASLEVRVPFLDNNIITFAHSLPDNYLSNAFEQKRILKSLLRKRLPESIVDAPKVGFHIPIRLWLRNEWCSWANEYFYSTDIENSESFLDIRKARVIWERFLNGNDQLTHAVWGMLMYFLWRVRYAV